MMSRVFYKKVEAALRSLQSSTDLKVSLCGETVAFDGLNSPYVSRQMVEVTHGHCIPKLMVVSNDKYWIAITPDGDDPNYPCVEGDCLSGKVPYYHFRELFLFPASSPRWFSGFVTVTVPDGFVGFDDKGHPLFKEKVTITARWRVWDGGKFSYRSQEIYNNEVES